MTDPIPVLAERLPAASPAGLVADVALLRPYLAPGTLVLEVGPGDHAWCMRVTRTTPSIFAVDLPLDGGQTADICQVLPDESIDVVIWDLTDTDPAGDLVAEAARRAFALLRPKGVALFRLRGLPEEAAAALQTAGFLVDLAAPAGAWLASQRQTSPLPVLRLLAAKGV
ncbi:MAG: hypothetical protein U0556_18845 [Dehalococcoidia bacterium]